MLYISDIYDKFYVLGVIIFHTDDTKLNIGFSPATEQSVVISKTERCLNDITSYMNLNYFEVKYW